MIFGIELYKAALIEWNDMNSLAVGVANSLHRQLPMARPLTFDGVETDDLVIL
jgi:hypothetical protein